MRADAPVRDIPVQLSYATEVRATARAIVDLLARSIQQNRLSEIRGAGHMAALTHTELVIPPVSAFLNARDS